MPELLSLAEVRAVCTEDAARALTIAAAGNAVHLVGGVVRDRFLGRETADLDAVVAGDAEAVAERLATATGARLIRLGGERFAAYRLHVHGAHIDLWGRGDESLASDLARRDLTINAIALSLPGGELADPFHGLADLAAGTLRATTAEAFTGDALRVLRLARFAVTLPDFTPAPETVALARTASPDLLGMASERIREELGTIAAHERAAVGFELLIELAVVPGLLLFTLGRGLPGKVAPAGEVLALWRALDRARLHLAALAPDLFHELRLDAARWALSAEGLGAPLALPTALAEAGFIKRPVADAATQLAAVLEGPGSELEMRRFLHRLGSLWPTAVAVLAARAEAAGSQFPAATLTRLIELARRHGEEILHPPRLLSGTEVSSLLGLPPGPEIGAALARVLAAQVDGRVRTKEEAVRLLRSTGGHATPG